MCAHLRIMRTPGLTLVLLNPHFLPLIIPDAINAITQAAFDKLTHDNADQKASFDNHMAKAELDASDQKASFDNHMAKAALDASDQKASFDNQMAKAELDAGGMKVCAHIYALCEHLV